VTRDGRCALRWRRPWRGLVTGLSCGRPARADRELVKVQSGDWCPGTKFDAQSGRRSVEVFDQLVRPVAVDPPESHDRGPPVARGSRPRRPTAHLAPANTGPGGRRLVEVLDRVEWRSPNDVL